MAVTECPHPQLSNTTGVGLLEERVFDTKREKNIPTCHRAATKGQAKSAECLSFGAGSLGRLQPMKARQSTARSGM